MSDTHASPLRPPPLYKQRSWSPDAYREEAWLRRKGSKRILSKNLTDEDLDELKACFELGFGFGPASGCGYKPTDADLRLYHTFPALALYYAVNKLYNDSIAHQTTSLHTTPSPHSIPYAIFAPGENPQAVKTRLRQWAQVVACSVRQCS